MSDPPDGPGPMIAEGGSREGWALLLAQMRRQWVGIVAGMVVGLVWTAGRVSIPWFVQRAIDEGMEPGDADRVRYWAIVIAVVALGTAICTGVRRYLAFREARRAEAELRDRLFAHLVKLSFPFYDRTPAGQLMSRANLDLQQVQNLFSILPLTMANLVTVAATAVVLITFDPFLTLLALGGLPLLVVLTRLMSSRLFPTLVQVQQESAELAEVVEETVAGIRVVKGFGAEGVQAERLAHEADDVYEASMAGAMVRARFWPVLEAIPSIGFVLVLAVGGHQVIDGDLTIGELVAFTAYVGLVVWPMRMLGWMVAMAQRAVASAGRVSTLFDTEPEVASPVEPVVLAPRSGRDGEVAATGRVRFSGVGFAYDGGAAVLAGMDLDIPAGQSVAVVGATGSGKSTVARLLCRFYDVDAGEVSLDGVDVRDLDLVELRKAIGLVFEDTFLFSDSIAANIAFADPEAEPSRIERAARLAGAHEFVSALSEGYDTMVGERGYSLSGGQRQRLAIARAILADPRVLILDDATSAVDPSKEHEIRDALAEVMRGRTTIVIAHRPATIALAERVVVLDEGRIVADGAHEHLLLTSDRYREVLAAAEQAEQDDLADAVATEDGER